MPTDRARIVTVVRRLLCVLVVACSAAPAGAAAKFDARDLQATGSFELVVTESKVLRPGTSRLRYLGAFASRVHGLAPGNAAGIEIVFLATPITDPMLRDILKNDSRAAQKGEYATLVLFLDRDEKVSQVNVSDVVPGTTVARTVAWKPDDLARYFSRVSVRGGRVALKSKGTYSDVEAGREALTLTWDVDVDLPVIREVAR